MVFTVDGDGHERKWGSLSRNIAWKAGRLWEDGNGVVKVFIEKGDERKEVDLEKRRVGGRESLWFLDKNQQPQETGLGELARGQFALLFLELFFEGFGFHFILFVLSSEP